MEEVIHYLQADAAVDRSAADEAPLPLVKCVDRSGRSAVLYASRGGSLGIVKLLCEAGGDFHAVDKDARSALAYAARRGHVEIAGWLLASGLVASQSDVHGLTPLHQAVLAKSPAMTELLLSSGADCTARDSNGLTPFMLARRFFSSTTDPKSKLVLQLLMDHEDRVHAAQGPEGASEQSPHLEQQGPASPQEVDPAVQAVPDSASSTSSGTSSGARQLSGGGLGVGRSSSGDLAGLPAAPAGAAGGQDPQAPGKAGAISHVDIE